MLRKITFAALLGVLISSQNAYAVEPFDVLENRFTKMLEYDLMDRCVRSRNELKNKRILICACALQKTQENGLWPDDYNSDGEYWDGKEKFDTTFKENADYYARRWYQARTFFQKNEKEFLKQFQSNKNWCS